MQSKTNLFNLALTALGQEFINTADGENAELCTFLYPSVLNSFLTSHPWDCCIKRAVLSIKDADSPAWGFKNRFSLPQNCIRVIRVLNSLSIILSDIYYKIESEKLLTSEDEVMILYLSKEVDINKMAPAMYAALAARMAVELGANLVGNTSVFTNAAAMAGEKLILAKQQNDAQSCYRVGGGSWLGAKGFYPDEIILTEG